MPGCQSLAPELLAVPLLGPDGGGPEVDGHKQSGTKKSTVEDLSWRGSCYGQGQVDETLAGVVRTDEVAKQASFRERILFQSGKIAVTFVLLIRGRQKDRESDKHAWRNQESEVNGPIAGQDGSCPASAVGSLFSAERNPPEPSIQTATLMVR